MMHCLRICITITVHLIFHARMHAGRDKTQMQYPNNLVSYSYVYACMHTTAISVLLQYPRVQPPAIHCMQVTTYITGFPIM